MKAASADPVAARLASDLRAMFGDRVERVILFGSRARGDARAESDYDLRVVMRSPSRADNDRLINWSVRLLGENVFVDVRAIPPERLVEPSLLMESVRREGVDL